MGSNPTFGICTRGTGNDAGAMVIAPCLCPRSNAISPVTSKEPLLTALREHFAVGAFNANNMEQVQGTVEAAEEKRAPVIWQVSQGAIRYAGLELAAGIARIAASLVSWGLPQPS